MRLYLRRIAFIVFGVLIALVLPFFIFRPFLYRNNDIWVCKKNKWVASGSPSYPKPEDPCGKKYPLPKNKDECLKANGVWKRMGPDPVETCNIKAADRGSVCTDNDECEGWCQANLTRDQVREGMTGKLNVKGKGTCSVWRVELGCFGILKKGSMSVICID